MKRFWKAARVRQAEGGFAVDLDQRPLRTPARAPLEVPTAALAEAIAAEWDAQGDRVDPLALPLTRAANVTIDRVGAAHGAVADAIAAFAATDLVCYRAPYPEGLVALQSEGWDPLLDWVAERYGARLSLAEGVMPASQPPAALAALDAAVRGEDAWTLTPLHELVALSGSLVLGLAVMDGERGVEEGWRLSRIDEDWNIREWGEDAEAAAQTARRAADFASAARLLELLGRRPG